MNLHAPKIINENGKLNKVPTFCSYEIGYVPINNIFNQNPPLIPVEYN